jgi:outer membrane protein
MVVKAWGLSIEVGIFFLLFSLLSPLIRANESTSLPGSTLEDFFTSAINFSPELRIAEENLNIGGSRKKVANGQLLPQLNAGSSISDNRLNQLNQSRNFDGRRHYVALTQTLFNWQQFSARNKAYLIEDQLEEEYYYQLAVILTDVADRYFSVLQSEDALDSIESEIEAVSNQLDQIQSLYDRQLAQITDLYQGQASLAASQAEKLRLEADLALTRETLRSISGIEVGPLYVLEDEVVIPTLEFSQQYYLQQAQQNNHQILAGEYAVKAADEGVSERKGAYMPRVSLIAQRQDSDVGFDNLPINRTDNTYIGLDISIPIYAGGANRASVSEALSQRNIVEYELRAIQLQVRERVRGAHLQVQASGVQTQAAEILVESTALASEAMQQGFALGTVTSVDVLNALRDQYQAEREFQRTRYEHIRYLLLLKRETGTLSAEDMLEIGSWLEPPQP